MATLEFWARINSDHTLNVPPEIAARLHGEEPVFVVVIVPETADDQAWSTLTAEQFLRGYAPGDILYDDLPSGLRGAQR